MPGPKILADGLIRTPFPMNQINKLTQWSKPIVVLCAVLAVCSSACLESYRCGRRVENRRMQTVLDDSEREIKKIRELVGEGQKIQERAAEDIRREADRAGMVLRAWQIDRDYDRQIAFYQTSGQLMDELEQLLIKKDFGTKLPNTIAAEWRPKREALDRLEKRSIDEYLGERIIWEREAKKFGITATFREALDLPADRVIDKRALQLGDVTKTAHGLREGP